MVLSINVESLIITVIPLKLTLNADVAYFKTWNIRILSGILDSHEMLTCIT